MFRLDMGPGKLSPLFLPSLFAKAISDVFVRDWFET
jgi:hypothetical protein